MIRRKLVIIPSVFLLTCSSRQDKPSETRSPSKFHHLDQRMYSVEKEKIDSTRKSFAKHLAGEDSNNFNEIKLQAATYLRQLVSDTLFDYWKGTPWDFNGVTQTPGEGKIACGYFVTTILRDAGYKLDRVKLSTCPSMEMMKALTSSKSIRNLSGMSYEAFTNWLHHYGDGLFIVGLDFHTGFVVTEGNHAWFIHSNYINHVGVMKEDVAASAALKSSKTRFITCLSDNEEFLRRWLLR